MDVVQETDDIDTRLSQFPLFLFHSRETEVHWSLISWQPLRYNHLQFIDKCPLLSQTVSHGKASAYRAGNPNQYSLSDAVAFPNWECVWQVLPHKTLTSVLTFIFCGLTRRARMTIQTLHSWTKHRATFTSFTRFSSDWCIDLTCDPVDAKKQQQLISNRGVLRPLPEQMNSKQTTKCVTMCSVTTLHNKAAERNHSWNQNGSQQTTILVKRFSPTHETLLFFISVLQVKASLCLK